MKTITVYTEAFSTMDWSSTPDLIEARFTEKDLTRYQKIFATMKELDLSYCGLYEGINYELYSEDFGDEDENEKLIKVEHNGEAKDFVVFTPEYRIYGGEIKLFSYADIVQILITLKHNPEEIWGEFKLSNLIKQMEAAADDQGV